MDYEQKRDAVAHLIYPPTPKGHSTHPARREAQKAGPCRCCTEDYVRKEYERMKEKGLFRFP